MVFDAQEMLVTAYLKPIFEMWYANISVYLCLSVDGLYTYVYLCLTVDGRFTAWPAELCLPVAAIIVRYLTRRFIGDYDPEMGESFFFHFFPLFNSHKSVIRVS